MADWNYKVPDPRSAPQRLWLQGRLPSYRADLTLPRVGLFCEEEPHAGELWLLGSFVPNRTSAERGEFEWSFEMKYPTGDGHVISVAGPEVQLVHEDERIVVAKDYAGRLFDAKTRARWPFKCGICKLAATFRVETFQKPMTALWHGGFREISLARLQLAVARSRD